MATVAVCIREERLSTGWEDTLWILLLLLLLLMILIIIIIITIIIIIIMILIIIIIITIIIIIIVAFKGAIRVFLQSPHCAAICLQHVRSSGPGAIVCKSRATHRALITFNMWCYMPRSTKGQLSYSV